MIVKTDFNTIYKIWSEYLWPTRQSKIETHSAMLLSKTYDLKNFDYTPSFFVALFDDQIIGCNSGHMCCDGTYRSRGLYVFPEYRKRGVGKELLLQTIMQGKSEDASLVWSYPRFESWKTYKSAGFSLSSEWQVDETGLNAYCQIIP